MKFKVRMAEGAEADLNQIYDYLASQASPETASAYVDRILEFLGRFDVFPNRGTVRDDLQKGLRVVGFERRISVAFVVESDTVVILRILYAGRSLEMKPFRPPSGIGLT
jgi:toxin ParE1/3/4